MRPLYLCSSQVNVWGARGEATTAAQNATPDASPPTTNQTEASAPAGETHSYQAEVYICSSTGLLFLLLLKTISTFHNC